MRLLIALFLLLTFTCQALPVAALGKVWAKAQLADSSDAADADDAGAAVPEDGKLKKDAPFFGDEYVAVPEAASRLCSMQAARQIVLHRPDHLPVRYAGEVDTPPPDRC